MSDTKDSTKLNYNHIGDILSSIPSFNPSEYKGDLNLERKDLTGEVPGYLLQDPNADKTLNNIRGLNQSMGERLKNGLVNFTGTTAATTVGSFATLGSLIGETLTAPVDPDGFEFSKIVDNPVQRGIDDANTWIHENFGKQFYSNEENESFITPTKFIPELMDQAGFMAGAILSGALTGGSGLGGGLSRIGAKGIVNVLKNGIISGSRKQAASEATSLLKNATLLNRAEQAGNTLGAAFTGGLYESTLQARMFKDEFKNSEIERRSKELGRDLNTDELNSLEEDANKAANTVTGLNMALLTASNFVQYAKWLGGSYNPTKTALNKINFTNGIASEVKEGTKAKLFNTAGLLLKDPLVEANEEILQTTIDASTESLFKRKYDKKGQLDTADYTKAISDGIHESYLKKETLQEGLYGFALGLFGSAGNIKTQNQTNKNTDAIINKLNSFGTSDYGRMYESLIRDTSIKKEADEALNKGDLFAYKNKENLAYKNHVKDVIDSGVYDSFISDLKNFKEDAKSDPEKFKEYFGASIDKENGENLIDNLLTKAEDIRKDLNSIDLKYFDYYNNPQYSKEDNKVVTEALRTDLFDALSSITDFNNREKNLIKQIDEDSSALNIVTLSLQAKHKMNPSNYLSDYFDELKKYSINKSINPAKYLDFENNLYDLTKIIKSREANSEKFNNLLSKKGRDEYAKSIVEHERENKQQDREETNPLKPKTESSKEASIESKEGIVKPSRILINNTEYNKGSEIEYAGKKYKLVGDFTDRNNNRVIKLQEGNKTLNVKESEFNKIKQTTVEVTPSEIKTVEVKTKKISKDTELEEKDFFDEASLTNSVFGNYNIPKETSKENSEIIPTIKVFGSKEDQDLANAYLAETDLKNIKEVEDKERSNRKEEKIQKDIDRVISTNPEYIVYGYQKLDKDNLLLDNQGAIQTETVEEGGVDLDEINKLKTGDKLTVMYEGYGAYIKGKFKTLNRDQFKEFKKQEPTSKDMVIRFYSNNKRIGAYRVSEETKALRDSLYEKLKGYNSDTLGNIQIGTIEISEVSDGSLVNTYKGTSINKKDLQDFDKWLYNTSAEELTQTSNFPIIIADGSGLPKIDNIEDKDVKYLGLKKLTDLSNPEKVININSLKAGQLYIPIKTPSGNIFYIRGLLSPITKEDSSNLAILIKTIIDDNTPDTLKNLIPNISEIVNYDPSGTSTNSIYINKGKVYRGQKELDINSKTPLDKITDIIYEEQIYKNVKTSLINTEGYNKEISKYIKFPIVGGDKKQFLGRQIKINNIEFINDFLVEINQNVNQDIKDTKADNNIITDTDKLLLENPEELKTPKLNTNTEAISRAEELKRKAQENKNIKPDSKDDYQVFSLAKAYTPKIIDKQEATKWFKDRFPNIPLEFKDRIETIDGKAAYGVFKNAMVYLSENAEIGTEYHEAFHVAFNLYLNDIERLEVLKHISKESGIPNTLNNALLLEEKLAEKFRDYILNKPTDNWFVRIFKTLKALIKSNFFKTTSYQELFSNIENKGYSYNFLKGNLLKRNISKFLNEERPSLLLGLNNLQEEKNILDKLTKDFYSYYTQGLVNFEDIFSLLTFGENGIITQLESRGFTKESEYIINNILVLEDKLKKQIRDRFAIDVDRINKDTNKDILDTDVENQEISEEDSLDFEIQGVLNETWADGGFAARNMKDKVSTGLKRIIMYLPQGNWIEDKFVAKRDRLGNIEYTDFDDTWELLNRNLVNLYTRKQMIDKLYELSDAKPELKLLADRLNKTDSIEDNLPKQFFTNFALQKLPHSIVLYEPVENSKGALESVKYKIIESDRSNVVNNLKRDWIDNSKDQEITKDFKKLLTFYKDFKLTANKNIKENRKDYLVQNTKTLLDKISINISIKALKFKAIDLGVYNTEVLGNIEKIIKYFKPEKGLEETSYLSKLAEVQSNFEDNVIESSFNNVEGNRQYSYTLNFPLSKLINRYKDNPSLLDDMLKDPVYYNSKLGKLLKKRDFRENFRYIIVGGIKEDKLGEQGSAYSKMSPKDLELSKIALFLGNNKGKEGIKYSYISTLVPSDSSSLPAIEFERISGTWENTNTFNTSNIPYNNEFAEELYNIFLQEQIRIWETKHLEREIKNGSISESSAIELYDYKIDKEGNKDFTKGQARQYTDFKTLFSRESYNNIVKYSDLNFDDFKTLEKSIDISLDDNKQVLIKDSNKDIIKQVLYNWLINETKNQAKYWSDLDVNEDSKLLDKSKIGEGLEFSNFNKFVTSYVLNSFIYSAETQKFFTGLEGYAGSQINYQKRAKSVVSPSVVLDTTAMKSPTYNYMVIRDSKKALDNINQIEETLNSLPIFKENVKKLVDSYSNINTTDGLGLITLEEYIEIEKGRGRYYGNIQKGLEDLLNGIPSELGLNIYFQMLKDIHVELFYNPKRNKVEKRFIKNAKLPLIPIFIKGTPLEELNNIMKSKKVSHLLFESAIKQGSTDITDLLDDKGKIDFNKLKDKSVSIADYKDYGIQLEVPEHHIDAENKLGVQIAKLIIEGIEDDFVFSDNTTGKELKAEYIKLLTANIDISYEELIDKIKTDSDVRELLMVQLSDLNENLNQLFNLDSKGNFTSPLWLNLEFTKRVEGALNGIWKKRLVQQTMNGGSYKQAPGFGLTDFGGFKELKDINKEAGINWLYGHENKLNFYTTSEGKVNRMQVLLPYWSKELISDNTIVDINELPKEVREAIGYRIPTQGNNSMIAVEIVGFLPTEMGSTIILPDGITSLAGSDFDIDTVFMMMPHIYKEEGDSEVGGKFKKVNYNFKKSVDNNSRRARENRIQDLIGKVLTEPKMFARNIDPLDIEELKDIKTEITSITGELENYNSVNLPYVQSKMSLANMMGKELVGIEASLNGNRSLAQLSKLKLKSVSIKFNKDSDSEGKENYEGRRKLYNIETNNQRIADRISKLLSAAVDNAKELIHGSLNSNSYTAGVINLILETGYNLNTAFYFINQPSIVNVYNKVKSNTGYGKVYTDFISENINQLLVLADIKKEDYEKEYFINNSDGVKSFTDEKMLESIILRKYIMDNTVFSKENLLSSVTSEVNKIIKDRKLDFSEWDFNNLRRDFFKHQIDTLYTFKKYRELVKERNTILRTQRLDTYDGNSLSSMDVLERDFKTLKNLKEGTANQEGYFEFDDSKLTNIIALKDYLFGIDKDNNQTNDKITASNFISRYVPFKSNAFNKAKDNILRKIGKTNNFNEELLDKINYELITALQGSVENPLLKGQTVESHIDRLINDTKNSLVKRFKKALKEVPELKDNLFIKNFKTDTIKRVNDMYGQSSVSIVEKLQFKEGKRGSFTEIFITEGFNQLLTGKTSENPIINKALKNLAEDLIIYAYITRGFQFGNGSYFRYIPTHYLQSPEIKYNEFLTGLQNKFVNENLFTDDTIDQVIRNLSNTKGIVKTIDEKDNVSYYANHANIELKPELYNQLVTTVDNIQVPIQYIKVYTGKGKDQTPLYKLDKVNTVGNKTILSYKKVDKLGRKGNKTEVPLKVYNVSIPNVSTETKEELKSTDINTDIPSKDDNVVTRNENFLKGIDDINNNESEDRMEDCK